MLIDAPLLHIEECCVVKLPHSRAMCTLHVVGINFQHGLCVHACSGCHDEVLVGFLRRCLLTVVTNQHASGKGTDGMIVQNIFVKLMTIAVRHGVINESVVVNMLIPISNHTSVAPAFGTFAFQNKVEAVACNAIMQRNNIVVYAAVGLLLNINTFLIWVSSRQFRSRLAFSPT